VAPTRCTRSSPPTAREQLQTRGSYTAKHAAQDCGPLAYLESTKRWIDEFVRAVLPHGTTAVAADPHEIANVLGVPGM
jgi:hypothetical protein